MEARMTEQNTKVHIDLSVQTATPLSVGAGGSAGTLADKSIVRDGWGRAIIPGSQVKGKTRHTAEALVRALRLPVYALFDEDTEPSPGKPAKKDVVRLLFGSPRQRSPLRFTDLVGVVGDEQQIDPTRLPPDEVQQNVGRIRPSVSLNRRRGTAEDARLLFQETTLEDMRFVGRKAITGTLDSSLLPLNEHLGLVALLWAALRLTTRWGGAKSRGLGWSSVEATVYCNGTEVSPDELEHALSTLVANVRAAEGGA
jgi:CRISPR/Cas system CSM-associated protein Csm3 (group 7 of RAMP superfamily)